MTHAFLARLAHADMAPAYGRVTRVAAGLVEATGPAAALGDICEIAGAPGERPIPAEIAAVDTHRVILIPLDDRAPARLDAKVRARAMRREVPAGDAFGGRAVDALARPLDGAGTIAHAAAWPLDGVVPRPLDRLDPATVLPTGLRAIDGLLTLGVGQRVGIFAASGVGKTSLVEQLAMQVPGDRCVLCLVGERGREVAGLWRVLQALPDRARFTLVAATSDESAARRVRAVHQALCLAEFWRARGERVVLMIDSVTRMAMALREIGLAAGAPPTVRAYTPNVFAALPRVVERCGAIVGADGSEGGAITAIMTVLSETDDVDDPIVELMKSLLDGHIVLSRTLAEQGHFPAVDIPRSISRQADRRVGAAQADAMRETVAMLAAYEEARVMIESGVYKGGTNAQVDRAIAARGALAGFLQQSRHETAAFDDTVAQLQRVAGRPRG